MPEIKGTVSSAEPLKVQSLIVSKAQGEGSLRVDVDDPTYPWHDILGDLRVLSPGASDPTLDVYRGGVRQFSFSNAQVNQVFINYHIPHDYVPGSDLYIHVHWSQIVVDTGGAAGSPGDVKWQWEASYSQGHNQAPFSVPVLPTLVATASAVQYQHLISEVQLSSASPSATQLDSDDIEVDGLILTRFFRDPADGVDTLNQVPFVHYVDIHYQSTGIGTKQKAPPFWT